MRDDLPDWSSSLSELERHQRKYEDAASLLRGGYAEPFQETLHNQALEHAWGMLRKTVMVIVWLYVRLYTKPKQ